jgi:type VI secretion system protein ImpE
MMTALELYREARLDEAIETALRSVKGAPGDIDARLLLCDLLSIGGQFERADRQLDIVLEQDAALLPGIGVYRQLLRAELARREVFRAGHSPEGVDDGDQVLRLHLQAAAAICSGNANEATALLGRAEADRPAVSGECDGEPFVDLRDLDDVTAPCLEVLTSTGKYYWIGWERIQRLEFKPPKYLRDVLWRQAEMTLHAGPEALVFVPVLYPETQASPDPEVRLGRKTDWIEAANGVTRGIGQRTLLVGERDLPLLSIGALSFAVPRANVGA